MLHDDIYPCIEVVPAYALYYYYYYYIADILLYIICVRRRAAVRIVRNASHCLARLYNMRALRGKRRATCNLKGNVPNEIWFSFFMIMIIFNKNNNSNDHRYY